MNRITTLRLIEAIQAIQRALPQAIITAIQFEDGSGNSFNYQIAGESKWRYIHWNDIVERLGYNPDNLVTIKNQKS